ncbi:hypothetical protein AGMMS49992_14150 [Clostridia bacterium]|nr:hypothetical protein AGMMS49992_14150 [Clostridia bacterium]
MNKHIDTAPVLEAFAAGGECPLCALRDQTEAGYLEQFLGGSVMEPASRVLVNEKGFCARHFTQLYAAGNRLGLALMAHSHLKDTIQALDIRWRGKEKRSLFDRLTHKGGASGVDARKLAAGHRHSCALCDRLDDTMERYVETTVWLWRGDVKFRIKFNESLGFCVTHAQALMDSTDDDEFRNALMNLEMHNLRRIEKELEWFTLKFDYRNFDKPWGTSKDALPRSILKLSGVNPSGVAEPEALPDNDKA